MKPGAGFLLDTNVFSELRKPRPHPNVLRFFHTLSPVQTYLSALTLGELRKGAAMQAKRNQQHSRSLSNWIDGLEDRYATQILGVDLPIARIWGELDASRTRPVVDTLLAATAIHHRLTLVTRNVRDVLDAPVHLLDPWQA